MGKLTQRIFRHVAIPSVSHHVQFLGAYEPGRRLSIQLCLIFSPTSELDWESKLAAKEFKAKAKDAVQMLIRNFH